MKYTSENLHFNHVWSSAFQKWFCLTTSDLSFREVSFCRMTAFKSQVNQTHTNFPGGCRKPDKHLTHSLPDLCAVPGVSACYQQEAKMLHVYTTSPIRSGVSCHEVSSAYHHCMFVVEATLALTVHLT